MREKSGFVLLLFLFTWLLAACGSVEAAMVTPQTAVAVPAAAVDAAPTPATTLPPYPQREPTQDDSRLSNIQTVRPTSASDMVDGPTPAPTQIPAPPTFVNPADPAVAAATAVSPTVLLPDNTGIWQYTTHSFVHPIALDVEADVAYLLDAGRVLALPLGQPQPPQILLQPGDDIGGVIALEPMDLSVADGSLLVLDRAGDVYAYDFDSQQWRLDRYDRAMRPDSANHYFVAIAGSTNGRFLLDTNYNYVQHYAAAPRDRLWTLPDARAVDVAVQDERVFTLLQEMESDDGLLYQYRETALVGTFRTDAEIVQPRQVMATEAAVFVLDMEGRRLLQLDPTSGRLAMAFQTPPETSAFWAGAGSLILAGRDQLFFYEMPQQSAWVTAQALLDGPQPHDPALLAALPPLRLPIGNALSARDLQLPGAPRHYRLGVHQGVDLYWRRGRPVTAVAAGTVVWATTSYENPTPAEFGYWDRETEMLGYSSQDALDFYRGRQIWIQHEGGLLSRYAHLDSIATGIVTGTEVVQGTLLGTVGNSGSPSSLIPAKPDTHVHVDLWLGQHYIGQFLRPVETRDWLERIFGIDSN